MEVMKLLLKNIKTNKLIIIFFTVFVVILFISPIHFNGLQDGYDGLSSMNRSKIISIPNDDNIRDLKYNGFVFKINAEELLSLVKQDEYSLVYLWHPNCSYDTVSIEYLYNNINSTNLILYIVSDSYEFLFDFYKKPIKDKLSLFVIDGAYYKIKIRYFYTKRFLNKLINKSQSSNFLLFKNGNFISDSDDFWSLYQLAN